MGHSLADGASYNVLCLTWKPKISIFLPHTQRIWDAAPCHCSLCWHLQAGGAKGQEEQAQQLLPCQPLG